MNVQRVLLIGRHPIPDGLPGLEVIEQKNVSFGPTGDECLNKLEEIEREALTLGAGAVIFQAVPNQVAAVFPRYLRRPGGRMVWGVVVSVPGARPGGAALA
jgi:hypothetical protein